MACIIACIPSNAVRTRASGPQDITLHHARVASNVDATETIAGRRIRVAALKRWTKEST